MPVQVHSNSATHWIIRGLWVLGTIAFIVYIPTKARTGTIGDMSMAFELATAVMALNLVMGFGGIISIGHSAFFALGGYVSAVLISNYGWSHAWTFPVAVVTGFVIGCAVSMPALRLRGIYLALVTLGLAVLFPTLVRWEKLEWLTAGARGIKRIAYKDVPKLPFVGDDSPTEERAIFMYWLAVAAAAIAYLVCRGIVKSRVGRSLVAIRDNETAAAVMGVNLAATKTVVFGISAALCALAGSLFAIRGNLANATEMPMFTLVGSITFLVVMTLGGAASLWGPVVGAIVYVWLDASARKWGADSDGGGVMGWLFGWMSTSPASLIIAIVILAMMFVAPFGIVGALGRLAAKFVVVVPAQAGTLGTVADIDTSALVPAGGGIAADSSPTPGGEP